ncbi:hypothetical protein AN958_09304 [Leucoagaricus sp. SymC.cos]|nr:hypothetical protein AN958_09304 [Leucoagaricus sp. SymC.cos]
MVFALLLHLAFSYGLLASGQLSPQPPLLPLAVKNPYLNAWRRNVNTTDLSDTWPVLFTKDRILGWDCLVRVDNQAYHWMGYEFNPTTLISSEITPTKTILRLKAGPAQFSATFLSPIEPDDYVRQSIPFTYMYIDGFSFNDSQPHSVQVYSDITGEWATSDNSARVKWDTKENHDMVYHFVTRQQPQPLEDNDNAADDGTVYFAMSKRPGHVWRTGSSVDCRDLFGNGTLSNGNDSAFRAVDKNWPVFSHAVDLGTISPGSQPDPVVWALGLVRDPLLVYSTLMQARTGYYWSAYSDVDAVISAFLNDFEGARDRSLQLDNKIVSNANQVSAEYADLLSLATRQIFGSMDITLAKEQDGSFNISDVKIFMKDMGASARANPVEVLYGALPALLYFNSSIAGHLIEPLLELQASAPYAAPDLGTTYPSILGNDINNASFVLDSTGSMLVMAYAHAVKSGDGSLLSRYHSTLARWADYLVNNVLDPPFGATTLDHLSAFGMTNLALKGILGLYSMAKVNKAVGSTNTMYMDHATQLTSRWRQFAVTDSHIMSIFNQSSSWGLMYNLFYATWLDSDIVSNSMLSLQAQFYAQQTPIAQYGYGLDSSNDDIAYPRTVLMQQKKTDSLQRKSPRKKTTTPNAKADLLSSQYRQSPTQSAREVAEPASKGSQLTCKPVEADQITRVKKDLLKRLIPRVDAQLQRAEDMTSSRAIGRGVAIAALFDIIIAVSGATSDQSLVFTSPLDFRGQATAFLEEIAPFPNKVPWNSTNSLFAIAFGTHRNDWAANDVHGSFKNTTGNGADLYDKVLDSYFNTVDRLYNAGARNFVFNNVVPFDRAQVGVSQGPQRQEKMRQSILEYNSLLASKALAYCTSKPDLSTCLVFDTHAVFTTIMDFPSLFGFKSSDNFCPAYANITDCTVNNQTSPSCLGSISVYIWRDTLHPSYAADTIWAKGLITQLQLGL